MTTPTREDAENLIDIVLDALLPVEVVTPLQQIELFIKSIPDPKTLSEVEKEFEELEDSYYFDTIIGINALKEFIKQSCTSYALSQVAEKDKEIAELENELKMIKDNCLACDDYDGLLDNFKPS